LKLDEFFGLFRGFNNKRIFMPYVNIKITKEKTTKKQKKKLVAGVTKLLKNILGKNPSTTFVIIEEIDCDNWGIASHLVSDKRKC